VALATKKKGTWLCPLCGHRNETRTSSRKCHNPDCGELSKPAKRRRKHAECLDTISYEEWVLISVEIHGDELYACAACGKPPSEGRRHDRDHDHKTGQPRGLLCPGNYGCNYMILPWITATVANAIYEAKAKAGESDAERWRLIAWYLERVEAYYAERA